MVPEITALEKSTAKLEQLKIQIQDAKYRSQNLRGETREPKIMRYQNISSQ